MTTMDGILDSKQVFCHVHLCFVHCRVTSTCCVTVCARIYECSGGFFRIFSFLFLGWRYGTIVFVFEVIPPVSKRQ